MMREGGLLFEPTRWTENVWMVSVNDVYVARVTEASGLYKVEQLKGARLNGYAVELFSRESVVGVINTWAGLAGGVDKDG